MDTKSKRTLRRRSSTVLSTNPISRIVDSLPVYSLRVYALRVYSLRVYSLRVQSLRVHSLRDSVTTHCMSTHCVSTHFAKLSLNSIGCQTFKWLRRPRSRSQHIKTRTTVMAASYIKIETGGLRNYPLPRRLKQQDSGTKYRCRINPNIENI